MVNMKLISINILSRWMSEKMDGIRAFWNGKNIISKHSKNILCPDWFTNDLPQEIFLDGELWIGRNKLEILQGLMKSPFDENNIWNIGWKDVNFMIFDLPNSKEIYEIRKQELNEMKLPSHVKVIDSIQCNGNKHLLDTLNEVVKSGGEGLMLNQPNSLYIQERTQSLLKVKVNE